MSKKRDYKYTFTVTYKSKINDGEIHNNKNTMTVFGVSNHDAKNKLTNRIRNIQSSAYDFEFTLVAKNDY